MFKCKFGLIPKKKRKNLKFVLIGAGVGFVISIFLFVAQDTELLFALSGAPFFLNRIIINSKGLVNYMTFLYFVIVFSFIGYLVTLQLKRMHLIIIILLLIALHATLVYSGAKLFSEDLSQIFRELSKRGVRITQ
jgi:hypothetical protein